MEKHNTKQREGKLDLFSETVVQQSETVSCPNCQRLQMELEMRARDFDRLVHETVIKTLHKIDEASAKRRPFSKDWATPFLEEVRRNKSNLDGNQKSTENARLVD